jgi:phytoene dehydrogenase-like protein
LSKPDADRWAAFTAQLTHWASFLETVYTSAPPRLVPSQAVEWLALFNLGRRVRGLGKHDMIELLRTMPMSVADWLDDWFETDALKGALGASGVAGMMQGPRSPGTAFVMLHRHVGCRGVVRPAWSAQGGIGKLAGALAEAARQRGAEIRTGARVEHILIKDGRATGVVLANGEEIAARRIVSNADPRHTLFDLVGPLHFDPDFVQAVRNIKFRGAQAKVNLALAGLPEFAGLPDGHDHLRGTILISPSLNYLERAYDDAKYGALSRRPHLEIRIPTLADPTLAPPGGHVMSIFVQYAPYHLRDGTWDSVRREALGDTVVETLAGYAPNIRSVILHRQVLTPLDLEQTFELTEGHLDHGELTLDQILFMRPAPGWAQYRTPIHNLYLCGAGTHPGGRTAGLSGYNAAREILKDVRRDA